MVTTFELRLLSEIVYSPTLSREAKLFQHQTISDYKKTFKWLKKKVKRHKRGRLKNILSKWYCIGSVFNTNKIRKCLYRWGKSNMWVTAYTRIFHIYKLEQNRDF